jgi:hypothetical protein
MFSQSTAFLVATIVLLIIGLVMIFMYESGNISNLNPYKFSSLGESFWNTGLVMLIILSLGYFSN